MILINPHQIICQKIFPFADEENKVSEVLNILPKVAKLVSGIA
jgi:hypothetical protein